LLVSRLIIIVSMVRRVQMLMNIIHDNTVCL
jgi:hypothetical protein